MAFSIWIGRPRSGRRTHTYATSKESRPRTARSVKALPSSPGWQSCSGWLPGSPSRPGPSASGSSARWPSHRALHRLPCRWRCPVVARITNDRPLPRAGAARCAAPHQLHRPASGWPCGALRALTSQKPERKVLMLAELPRGWEGPWTYPQTAPGQPAPCPFIPAFGRRSGRRVGGAPPGRPRRCRIGCRPAVSAGWWRRWCWWG
jgi:hypothetical protein